MPQPRRRNPGGVRARLWQLYTPYWPRIVASPAATHTLSAAPAVACRRPRRAIKGGQCDGAPCRVVVARLEGGGLLKSVNWPGIAEAGLGAVRGGVPSASQCDRCGMRSAGVCARRRRLTDPG